MKSPHILKYQVWLIIGVFAVTRLVIWVNKPLDFSLVTHTFMPYAHLWADGHLPYLNQVYEYPPLTVPLFYLPHMVDMATNRTALHLDYGNTYRGLLMISDCLLFLLLAVTLKRLKVSSAVFTVSLLYYSLATVKANHFMYDSYDLIFAGVIALGLAAPVLWKKSGSFVGWLSFVMASALKYVNLPLGLPLFLGQKQKWKTALIEVSVAFVIVWGLPAVVFRSSLLVTFVYHQQRGLQIESGPATLARSIDQFTHSERTAEISQAIDIQGPVSLRIFNIMKFVFPLSLLAYVTYVSLLILRRKAMSDKSIVIWYTLGYVALFTALSTVLSTPYLLWHIPLVTMLPTRSVRQKLVFMVCSLLIVGAGMTGIPNLPLWPFTLHIWIGWLKVAGFAVMTIAVIQHLQGVATRDRNV